MNHTLHALFIEIDNNYQFYKYFWEGMDAFHFGESSSVLINEKITSYKLEEHKVLGEFDYRNDKSYFKLATNYEVISPT